MVNVMWQHAALMEKKGHAPLLHSARRSFFCIRNQDLRKKHMLASIIRTHRVLASMDVQQKAEKNNGYTWPRH